VRVERPKSREHGDWATNIALQLGKKAGMAPRDFAQLLAGLQAGGEHVLADWMIDFAAGSGEDA